MGPDICHKLKKYFDKKDNIAFAFLFGSFSKNKERNSSDIDIAIYFFPDGNDIDFESEKYFEEEDVIWSELEDILKKEIDLVVLNRAPATVAFNAIRGFEIINKDYDLFYRFFNYSMFESIDYNEMILRDFEEGLID